MRSRLVTQAGFIFFFLNTKVQVVKSEDFDKKSAKSPIFDEFFRDCDRFFASNVNLRYISSLIEVVGNG
jgi:hypothetical protein